MTPIKRRTFFGQTSDDKLRKLEVESQYSNNVMRHYEHMGKDIPVELWEQRARDVEMGLAAGAELERRAIAKQWPATHTREGRLRER